MRAPPLLKRLPVTMFVSNPYNSVLESTDTDPPNCPGEETSSELSVPVMALMNGRASVGVPVAEAGRLVEELFSKLEAPGMVRLREHARRVGEQLPPDNLRDIIDDLHELLRSPRSS